MRRYSLPHATLSRTLTCAELCPREGGAVLRFYIRREFLLRYNGARKIQRLEASGKIEFKGPRPFRPRRLCELTVEGARVGGG